MNIIYNLFVSLYGLGISAASAFNPKAKRWLNGRKDWKGKMRQAVSSDDKIIWVHCSSLGEFEQGRPVMERIRKKFPGHKIALSFFSPSGYEVRKNYEGADYVFYLPLDTKRNAKSIIKILHPEILILVKYEYWYNLLKKLQKKNIPVIVISAVIKENNIFIQSWGAWFRKRIEKITHFFVQDGDSKDLLESIGVKQVTISGDTRFDRVREIRQSSPELEFVEIFKGDHKLIVAGSTWPDDEEILTCFINQKLPDDWKVIFAPHNIDDKQVRALSEKLRKKTALYTKSDSTQIGDAQILIVDTVGVLTKIYAYADISYVGGGFTRTGVHNTLEPAVFGVPVIFGPNYENYFEAIDLIQTEGAQRFKDQHDFNSKMEKLIQNEPERKRRGNAAAEYIAQKPNSSNLIMDYLRNLIKHQN